MKASDIRAAIAAGRFQPALRHMLAQAGGARLTTAQIVARAGMPAASDVGEGWQSVCDVIWHMTRMKERDAVKSEHRSRETIWLLPVTTRADEPTPGLSKLASLREAERRRGGR